MNLVLWPQIRILSRSSVTGSIPLASLSYPLRYFGGTVLLLSSNTLPMLLGWIKFEYMSSNFNLNLGIVCSLCNYLFERFYSWTEWLVDNGDLVSECIVFVIVIRLHLWLPRTAERCRRQSLGNKASQTRKASYYQRHTLKHRAVTPPGKQVSFPNQSIAYLIRPDHSEDIHV